MVRTRLLLAALWAGSLWTVGYLVAPTLFATLSDKVLAGMIAGSIFRVEAWVSLACGLLLIILAWKFSADASAAQRATWLKLIVAMLVCLLVGYFGLQPFMAALREGAGGTGGVMSADARTQFGILHGVASGLYLIQSLLAVVLILKIR